MEAAKDLLTYIPQISFVIFGELHLFHYVILRHRVISSDGGLVGSPQSFLEYQLVLSLFPTLPQKK